MKTKKQIFEWWCGDGGTSEAHKSFLENIAIPYIRTIRELWDHTTYLYEMIPPRCKYPIKLLFDDTGICIKIIGF